MGFKRAKTILATGSVYFEAGQERRSVLIKTIEQGLKKAFGFDVLISLRTLDEIQAMEAARPFSRVAMTPETRLYVTFLAEPRGKGAGTRAPAQHSSLRIVRETAGEVFSVVTLSEDFGTTDAMNILAKHYGNKVTTRSWHTIERILKGVMKREGSSLRRTGR